MVGRALRALQVRWPSALNARGRPHARTHRPRRKQRMAEIAEGVPDATGGAEPEPEPAPGGMQMTKSRKADTSTKHKELNKLVLEALMRAYREKLRPLEAASAFSVLNQPLSDAEFNAPPSVLLVGQYSVGKTTFIRNLIGKDFNQRIGPEPTTDKFTVVYHGDDDVVVPGNSLAMQTDKPYRPLTKFGVGFLDRFEGASCDSEILEQLTFVDTPGVLAGDKQRSGRGYDFNELVSHFALRADMILLLFDANKLDVSDEMREAILAMQSNFPKLKVVLNKADTCTQQQLMQVHGALMWQLAPIIKTPEVARVYCSSFRDDSYNPIGKDSYALFDQERTDLLRDLETLPRKSVMLKINNLITRARLCKVHTLVLNHIKGALPTGVKKQMAKQEEMFEDIETTFKAVATANKLSSGDFPNTKMFTESFAKFDFSTYEPVNEKLLHSVDKLLVTELPLLMKMLPTDAECRAWEAEDVVAGAAAEAAPAAGAAAATTSTEEGAVLESACHVQFNGKGDFKQYSLKISAGSLVLAADGQETRTAAIAGCGSSEPKSVRKGHEHSRRLDLPQGDSKGCRKLLISVADPPLLQKLIKAVSVNSSSSGDINVLRTALHGPGAGWEVVEEGVTMSGRRQVEDEQDWCTLCGNDFGLTRRKKVCKSCGVVCCFDCSDDLPNSQDGSRWCHGCKTAAAV